MIFTVIDIDLNRPNWLPAGYYVNNRVVSRAFPRVPSPLCLWQARKLGTSDGAVRDAHMFMTGPWSRHCQQRCLHAGRPGPPGWDALADFGQGISGCAILQQGMRLKVFSEVYCDRVYFWCAERFVTGSGFEPPSGTLLPSWDSSSPPPPPPGVRGDLPHYIYTLIYRFPTQSDKLFPGPPTI